MCRCMMTDQFIGITFLNLIKNNIFDIEFSSFNEIEKKVDMQIREKNNAMLCISWKEIYSTIDEYNDFFVLNHSKIEIKNNTKLKHSKEEREHFLSRLYDYFTAGIPKDINSTINEVLQAEFREKYVTESN